MSLNRFSESRYKFDFFLQNVLPIVLSIASALFWFPPSKTQLTGFQGDSYFNLFTFSAIWQHLSRLGLFKVFSYEFWQLPILYPQKLGLALSENQLYPGILMWPLRQITGNGTLTMNLFAAALLIAASITCGIWLKSLGAKRFAWWGGLFFATSGWLQVQNFHYQNMCVFLFPLAFLAWGSWREKKSFWSLIGCAFAFGWIGGWNLYFQMFANLILMFLIGRAGLKERKNIRQLLILFGLGFCTLLIELPIILKYFEVSAGLGGAGVTDGVLKEYSANVFSLFATVPTLLQRFVPVYPSYSPHYEGAGFLGVAWLVCCVLAWKRGFKPFLLAALAAFLVALGPNGGVFYLIRFLPGFNGMRAIGRAEVLVQLFSLVAVILFLETKSRKFSVLAISLIALELLPAGIPRRMPVHPQYDDPTDQPFVTALRDDGPDALSEPLLIIPVTSTLYQLDLLKSGVPLYYGYTSKLLANSYNLEMTVKRNPQTADNLAKTLLFSRAKRLAVVDGMQNGDQGIWTSADTEKLKTYPFLEWKGCYALNEMTPCLFNVKWNALGSLEKAYPPLRLDRDTEWEYPDAPSGEHIALLKATRDGTLDYVGLSQCTFLDTIKFPGMPAKESRRELPSAAFRGVVFKKGDVIFDEIAKKPWFRLPKRFRPEETYAVHCG